MGVSLWGEEFTVKKPEVKKVLAKVNNPKDPKVIKRVAKSSALSILDQLALIRTNVEKFWEDMLIRQGLSPPLRNCINILTRLYLTVKL